MKTWLQKNKQYFLDKKFLISLATAFLFLIISLIVNFYAGIYATEHASNPVTDIILNNIRTYDVDGLFVYGSLIFWGVYAIISFFNIRKIPYALKTISVFVLSFH